MLDWKVWCAVCVFRASSCQLEETKLFLSFLANSSPVRVDSARRYLDTSSLQPLLTACPSLSELTWLPCGRNDWCHPAARHVEGRQNRGWHWWVLIVAGLKGWAVPNDGRCAGLWPGWTAAVAWWQRVYILPTPGTRTNHPTPAQSSVVRGETERDSGPIQNPTFRSTKQPERKKKAFILPTYSIMYIAFAEYTELNWQRYCVGVTFLWPRLNSTTHWMRRIYLWVNTQYPNCLFKIFTQFVLIQPTGPVSPHHWLQSCKRTSELPQQTCSRLWWAVTGMTGIVLVDRRAGTTPALLISSLVMEGRQWRSNR